MDRLFVSNFVSNFVSKIITFLFCKSQNYPPYRKFIFTAKTAQTRMNTRKTRNPMGCGSFRFLVGVGGLEPLKMSAKPA